MRAREPKTLPRSPRSRLEVAEDRNYLMIARRSIMNQHVTLKYVIGDSCSGDFSDSHACGTFRSFYCVIRLEKGPTYHCFLSCGAAQIVGTYR